MKVQCPHCKQSRFSANEARTIYSNGRFYRRSDGQWISRFWCSGCGKSFSYATFNSRYRQKKRHQNRKVQSLLCAGVSQREAARILKINRKTVVRKFLFMSEVASSKLRVWNRKFAPAVEVQFDDLETHEHSKCKPLSVTLIVEARTRRILDFEVARMPAKGPLAEISRKKYGFRKDERAEKRKILFQRAKPLIAPHAQIRSDSNPHYPADVKRFFPKASHETVLGARGAITGQGELKKIKFDPLFSLNHTCAMLRANVNRLIRKTWCTTKKPERLRAHLVLYAMSHNLRLSTA